MKRRFILRKKLEYFSDHEGKLLYKRYKEEQRVSIILSLTKEIHINLKGILIPLHRRVLSYLFVAKLNRLSNGLGGNNFFPSAFGQYFMRFICCIRVAPTAFLQ